MATLVLAFVRAAPPNVAWPVLKATALAAVVLRKIRRVIPRVAGEPDDGAGAGTSMSILIANPGGLHKGIELPREWNRRVAHTVDVEARGVGPFRVA